MAITDKDRQFVFPLVDIVRLSHCRSLEDESKLLWDIRKVCRSNEIGGIVIGFPLHPVTKEITPICVDIMRILTTSSIARHTSASSLSSSWDDASIPCTLWSEYNTTVNARRSTRAFRCKSIKTFMDKKDRVAASFILRHFLEYNNL